MSALVFVFVLGVLVIVHEWGHFVVARVVGIRVEKFSVGFGPVVFSRKKGETEYCVSLLPLGGFVKLAGENPQEAQGQPWEFNSKSLWQKAAVVLAGPFMNAFLAFALFSGIFLFGQPTLTTKIGQVLDGSPAKEAGLLESDKIVAVNGQAVANWQELLKAIRSGGETASLTIERAGVTQNVTVRPMAQEVSGVFGQKKRTSVIGIAPSNEMIYVKSGFFEALWLGAERVWTMTAMIFHSLAMMITGAMPFKDSLTGPIGIFFMTEQAAKLGLIYLLYFMGSLSVSLFVLNLLPIPVLDGGHLLFIVIERLKGSPLKESVKERMTQGGLVLLLALMAFVILQDINRFSIVENIKNLIK